ncbi:MAG: peptidylprolyl isomerase [bacterium]
MPRPGRLALTALLAAAALSAGLAACGDDEGSSSTTSASTAAGGASCEDVAAPEPKSVKLKPPGKQVKPGLKITATVATNCGEFEFALDTVQSPKTASSFVQLVDEGVYDGTGFHRVVSDFVIQGGDPAGDGSGGPGYSVTEKPPADTSYTRGTVAMAKTAAEPPGGSGSQFFVVTAADAGLPADYAILGKVTSGEDTVEKIEAQADPALGPAGGQPLVPVVIQSITLN